jgi:hypothetical protein
VAGGELLTHPPGGDGLAGARRAVDCHRRWQILFGDPVQQLGQLALLFIAAPNRIRWGQRVQLPLVGKYTVGGRRLRKESVVVARDAWSCG